MPNCCHISICQTNSVYKGRKHCSTPSQTCLSDIKQTRAHPYATAMSTRGSYPHKAQPVPGLWQTQEVHFHHFLLGGKALEDLKERKLKTFSYKNIFVCTMPAFIQNSEIPSLEKPVKGQSFSICVKNILWSPEPLTCSKKAQTHYKILTLGSFSTT